MEEFTRLFHKLLDFVYECFDRIVIHGYLSGLSRPEQVVYFVRQILGIPVVSKEVLSQRTRDYQNWVEAYAQNHHLPWNGPRRECARKTMSCPAWLAWSEKMSTGSISSSRAWSRCAPQKPLPAHKCTNLSAKVSLSTLFQSEQSGQPGSEYANLSGHVRVPLCWIASFLLGDIY